MDQWRSKWRRAALLQGRQFRSQMYFYYTNRGGNIYLAPDGNIPCSATEIDIIINNKHGSGRYKLSFIKIQIHTVVIMIRFIYRVVENIKTKSTFTDEHNYSVICKII